MPSFPFAPGQVRAGATPHGSPPSVYRPTSLPIRSLSAGGFRSGTVQGLLVSRSGSGRVVQRFSRPGTEAFQVSLQPRSGGWTLPKEVQRKMEQALGADFSDVRIFVGSEASSIGALAFTWGSNLHFAPGQYNPHTPEGQFLLGHELAHVVQQRSGRVANPFGGGVAVVQDTALEAEADRLGRYAASYRG